MGGCGWGGLRVGGLWLGWLQFGGAAGGVAVGRGCIWGAVGRGRMGVQWCGGAVGRGCMGVQWCGGAVVWGCSGVGVQWFGLGVLRRRLLEKSQRVEAILGSMLATGAERAQLQEVEEMITAPERLQLDGLKRSVNK